MAKSKTQEFKAVLWGILTHGILYYVYIYIYIYMTRFLKGSYTRNYKYLQILV